MPTSVAKERAETAMQLEDLESVRLLRRSDDRTWDDVITPVLRDTLDIRPDAPLTGLNQMVAAVLRELERYPLPVQMIYVAPEDQDKVDPWTFASMLVAHRAERLLQLAELAGGALNGLERGTFQLSAVAARTLLELGVACWDVHQASIDPWRRVHGSIARVRAESRSPGSRTFQLLWETRMGSRIAGYKEHGYPQAVNTMTRLKRFGKGFAGIDQVYASLCDATHPNLESQATLWRANNARLRARPVVELAPGHSNSPTKADVVGSVRLGIALILPFARDLWWVAADIANACDLTPTKETRLLGLPARSPRDQSCSCGSGLTTSVCPHVEPQFDHATEFGWAPPAT